MNNPEINDEILKKVIGQPPDCQPSDNFINRIMRFIMTKRLYRSKTDRKIAGICGGLADYFQIDPVIIRLGFVALFFINGITAMAYIIGWLIIPKQKLSAD